MTPDYLSVAGSISGHLARTSGFGARSRNNLTIATVSYYSIEQPFLRLKRRFDSGTPHPTGAGSSFACNTPRADVEKRG
jgi:hypothetical protein